MDNPFQYSEPALPKRFCNRTEELKDLKNFIKTGNRVVLVSERKLGKTSLIKRLLSTLPQKDYVGVYIDLWGTFDQNSFIKAYASAFAEHQAAEQSRVLRFLKQYIQQLIPSVRLTSSGHIELQLENRSQQATMQDIEAVLQMPQALAEKIKKRVVVAIDEFQTVAHYHDDRLERHFRSASQFHDKVSYIYSGTNNLKMEDLFNHPERALYKSAVYYPLSAIPESHWRAFIRETFKLGQREVDKAALKRLSHFTEGNPFYNQFVCFVLWEQTEPGDVVTAEKVQEAIEIIITREDFRFCGIWELLTQIQKRVLLGLAKKPSIAPFSKSFAEATSVASVSSVQSAFEQMMSRGILVRQQGQFSFSDIFFRTWLLKRFEGT